MDDRVLQFRVGVVIVTALLILGIFVFFFLSGGNILASKYTIYIRFNNAPGVVANTPIRKSGILIGRVQSTELLNEQGVLVTARIDSHRPIGRHEVCRLGSSSLLGDAVLEFVPSGDKSADTTPLSSGDYIEGVVAADPIKVLITVAENMPDAMRKIQLTAREAKSLAANLNTLVGNNEEQLERILQGTERAIGRFDVAMGNLNDLVGDPEMKQKLKKSLEDLPEMFTEVRETLKSTRETMASFERVGKRAEQNLENLEAITTPLAEKGPTLVGNIERTTQNIDELMEQTLRITEALNNRQGTLGKLVYEPDIYDRLNRAAGNIEDATRQVKPIIADARVAADKVARDPSIIVKGALSKQPSSAGSKFNVPSRRVSVPTQYDHE